MAQEFSHDFLGELSSCGSAPFDADKVRLPESHCERGQDGRLHPLGVHGEKRQWRANSFRCQQGIKSLDGRCGGPSESITHLLVRLCDSRIEGREDVQIEFEKR